jgi:hypothetical protein
MFVALGAVACSRVAPNTDAPSLAQWLDACSLLESADERKSLDFLGDHTVIREVVPSGTVLDDGARPTVTKGTWSGSDTGRAVNVQIGGRSDDYVLYLPAGEQQCILAGGAPETISLQTAWFGVPDFSAHADKPDP